MIAISIEVEPSGASVEVGGSYQFEATATLSDQRTMNVTGEATWHSSDGNVATIADGRASGLQEGTARITATLHGLMSNEAVLTVAAAAPTPTEPATPTPTAGSTPTVTPSPTPPVTPTPGPTATPSPAPSVAVTGGSGTIGVDEAVQFSATITYADGSTVDVTGTATWNSSDDGVVTVIAGMATGHSEGTAEITVTLGGVTSDPITLTVSTPVALQWWAILAIVAGILAAGLLLVGMRRRARQWHAI